LTNVRFAPAVTLSWADAGIIKPAVHTDKDKAIPSLCFRNILDLPLVKVQDLQKAGRNRV
jgi:hypothetical protein